MRRALILVVTVVLVLPASPAIAQEDDPPEGAMLIILDASGSMNSLDQDGVPFIDKAKDAVIELVGALPDGMEVGLRVYGHREPNTDAVRGCQDTELVAPVAPLDRDAISSAVEGLEASGFTPIGLSLIEAAADLPETGPRSIVLISDGEDTCAPPDPCQIAEDLYGDLFDVRIESVGFLIDTGSAAEQQLRCIAETTGGSYTTVGRADELVARLGEVTAELLAWVPPMTLNGALEQVAAPEIPIAANPDWLSDEPGKIGHASFAGLLMPGETRWFQLDLWQWEAFWVWSDLEWPLGLEAGGGFEAIILDPNGDRVERPAPNDYQRIELPGTRSPMIGVAPDLGNGPPPGEAVYLIGLHWDAPAEVFLGALYVWIDVLNGDWRYEERTHLEGSLDPSMAPDLDLAAIEPGWRGGAWRGSLVSGETRWYRMNLERGEVMTAWALFPGDRVVGESTSGEFIIQLTDLDGNTVGQAFRDWPQMGQDFGTDRHQATVSGTTSLDPDPIPETVLIGFGWDGPAGQISEIRFEAEAVFDAGHAEMADQIKADKNGGEREEPTDRSTTTSLATTTAVSAADEDRSDGGGGSALLILIAIGVAVAGATGAILLVRRNRTG